MVKKIFSFFVSISFLFLFSSQAFAHEAYVLTHREFSKGLLVNSPNPLGPLFDPSYLKISAIITFLVMLSYFFAVLWATTPIAKKLDGVVRKAKVFGPFIIRIAISSSFFFAAEINSMLGPELSLSAVPGGDIIRLLLFVIAFMVLLGVFVEVAAFIGILLFIYLSNIYGIYMLTYLNYFGELLVLLFFGSRLLSFDGYFFGKKLWFKKMEKFRELEIPIVRVLYGLALIYAGWSIKFQHQELSVMVYNQYHLKDFFHASAQFIAAGAGLSEILIGVFILIGFVMRFTILISLVFITLSLIYFHEMLWPHLMLYGISFSLIINSADKYTIDRYLIPRVGSVLKKAFKFIGR